jgi:uncharacterized MAPEG superfamily protein
MNLSASAQALLGYVLWTLLLLGLIALQRAWLVVVCARPVNQFSPDGKDISPLAHRLCRAHANCCENLPLFASIVLLALAIDRPEATDPLAPWCLAARVAQSTMHILSRHPYVVSLRFVFFVIQIVIQSGWVLSLLFASR